MVLWPALFPMNIHLTPIAKRFLVLSGALVLAGCATTAPKARFTQALPAGSQIRLEDSVKVAVTAAPDVSVLPYEEQRLAEEIGAKIAQDQKMSAPAGHPRAYDIEVELTRYEKGSAFARAVLAGLGQIHIDGRVTVYLLPAHTRVGEFTVNKTFAWGGLYGGTTSMPTVEQGFAEGIAAAVTRREGNGRTTAGSAPSMGASSHG